jgi:hypothetical protein
MNEILQEYLRLIESVDSQLKMAATMHPVGSKERTVSINNLLDERIRLMKSRDTLTELVKSGELAK